MDTQARARRQCQPLNSRSLAARRALDGVADIRGCGEHELPSGHGEHPQLVIPQSHPHPDPYGRHGGEGGGEPDGLFRVSRVEGRSSVWVAAVHSTHMWPRLRALALAAEGAPAGCGGALNSTESAFRVTLIHLPRPSHPRVAVPSPSSLLACLLYRSCPLPSHHPAACHRFPSMLRH